MITDFSMTGMMTITMPEHANTSISSIKPVPLKKVAKSLNVTLRRGTTNIVNTTEIYAFNVTKFEGRTMNI
jgi:hypothetical protein